MSSIGEKIKISIFGESHGPAIGVVIDGLPANYEIDLDKIAIQMARRAPGNPAYGTARKEADLPEIVSGYTNGKTNGFPLCAIIRNTNAHSSDYANLKLVPRPAHADYPAFVKYFGAADMSGGGHFSGRLTAPLVFAGAVARQILEKHNIKIAAHVKSLGNVVDETFDETTPNEDIMCELSKQPFAVISDSAKQEMLDIMADCRKKGDSVGGRVETVITGLPVGVGGPLFDGIDGKIATYIFGIPAVKGIEFGRGFESAEIFGSENNDDYFIDNGNVKTKTNNCGGIVGGMTNGMPLVFTTAFKPTPSIALEQDSVELNSMKDTKLKIKGRHDPCVVPRAVVCVESATALAIIDELSKNGVFGG